jgi:uncharacterized protein DUF3631
VPENETGALLAEIESRVKRYVRLTAAQAVVIALFVLHTHAFEAAESTPYLLVSSPEKQSGKTRLLELLSLYVRRPWLTSRVTAAVLMRKVDKECPTLLLDESDSAFRSGSEYAMALTGLLNSGYRLGGSASVCIAHGSTITYRDFATFCPKVIAGIGSSLPDTVRSRGLSLRMKRRAPAEPIERFRWRDAASEAIPLVEAVSAWAKANVPLLVDARPELPAELSDRIADCVEPLIAIADLAGSEWGERAREAVVSLAADADAEDDSSGVLLLADLRSIFESTDTTRVPSSTLVSNLTSIEESPWAEWRQGKPLTPNTLARLLRPFGIRPTTVRTRNGIAKGYKREDFGDAWLRYLPSEPLQALHPATGAESKLELSRNGSSNVTALHEVADPDDKPRVTGVTVEPPSPGDGGEAA